VLGLYLSIPFCKFKCTYCNFASGVFPRAQLDRYLLALESELGGYSGAADTLYLGGGTPSLLTAAQIERLLGAVRRHFEIAPNAEITLEAAPGTFDDALVGCWAACGVNRISFGVQSFVESELRAVGRLHRFQTVADDFARLRDAGISDLGIDLIAGLPHQTPETWEESLAAAFSLSPTHVSVYILEVDQDSRLGAELLAGGARYSAADVPDEDTIAGMYASACDRLAQWGYQHYEISNFALPGRESRHNRKYWNSDPYLGFGVDAHSYDERERRGNVDSVEEYISRVEQGESAVATREIVDDRRYAEERLFLGLRQTAGVMLTDDDRDHYGEEISRLITAGLIEFSSGRLRLTQRGLLLSNEVFEIFV
jgi:oxygen-independent coproporphyrinogen-3 oxidase